MKTILCTLLLLISLPLAAQSQADREAIETFRLIVEAEERQEKEANEKARQAVLARNAPQSSGGGGVILFLLLCGVFLGIKESLEKND